jgi:hypothetical protein
MKTDGDAAMQWVSKLGECADAKCGCYRLWRPDVRRHFRDVVVALTVSQLTASLGALGEQRSAVHYVTLGSGQLLTDMEVLCGLVDAGLVIESILAVDKNYAAADELPASDDSSPPSEADRADAQAALAQVAACFAPVPVSTFGSLERLEQASALEPSRFRATTLVQCDSALPQPAVRRIASAILSDGGHLFQLSNLGMGHIEEKESPRATGGEKCQRLYLRAQLRDGSSVEAWRLVVGGLEPIDGASLKEDDAARGARHASARRWLESSTRDIASQLGLTIWAVVYDDAKNGRHTVAVRSGPSRSHAIVAVRHRGEEVLVAEEKDGWVRLSEEDDDWGWQVRAASKKTDASTGASATPSGLPAQPSDPLQAWMLIDGAEVGLGRLLERVWPLSSTPSPAEGEGLAHP